jgi:hypothetical protein
MVAVSGGLSDNLQVFQGLKCNLKRGVRRENAEKKRYM